MSENDPWKRWYQEPTPSDPSSADRTVSMPQPSNRPTFEPNPGSGGGGYGAGGYGGGGYGGGAGGGGGWGVQPPLVSPPGTPPVGAPGQGGPGSGRRWRFWGQPGRHGRRIALVIGVVILLFIAGTAGTYFWVNGKLNRSVTLPATTATSAGTNWLIAGSDQRTGISRTERAQLHLGADGADASDSLMLLHMGTGKPVLISIPRDSYVPIPGHGSNKINAALAIGGPTLLVQTVESVTGLKIDHYMGIGFGGLANVVSAVGGVQMCVKTAVPADPTGDSGFKGLAAWLPQPQRDPGDRLRPRPALVRHLRPAADPGPAGVPLCPAVQGDQPGRVPEPVHRAPVRVHRGQFDRGRQGHQPVGPDPGGAGATRPADRHRADRQRQLPDQRGRRGGVGPGTGTQAVQCAKGGQRRSRPDC